MTRFTTGSVVIPYPDYKEKPYDATIQTTFQTTADEIAAVAAGTVQLIYNTIGTVSAPGELRQNEGTPGSYALAKGFWVANDGGHGFFSWIVGSAIDDGFSIIVPIGTPSGYWKRLYQGNVINARWAGVDSAAADSAPYISTIVTALGSDTGAIYFPNEPGSTSTTYVIGTNLTIPSNISVFVERGVILSVDASIALVINSTITADPYQIFAGSGTVTIGGGTGWSNWFATINAGINSGLDKVKTKSGVYQETATVDVPSDVNWDCERASFNSDSGVVIRPTSAVNRAVKMYGSHYLKVKNLTIDMANMSDVQSVGPATTISFATAADGGTISDSGNGLGGFNQGELIGVTGSTSNDGTYIISTVAAGSIFVKGPPLVNESAGASITLNEGAIGLRLQGSRRAIYEFVQVIHPGQKHGWSAAHVTPQSPTIFSSYYNLFLRCGFKSVGGASPRYGNGFTASSVGIGTVTNNTLVECEIQACDIDYLFASTGSGVMLVNCNGESANKYGCYVTDVPSADSTAVKVLGGEWDNFGAGEPGALFVWQSTANSGYDDNVLYDVYGKVFNAPIRGDYYIGKETIVNDLIANDTLDPSQGEHLRIEGASAAITLDTTTPISDGDRGQRLELIGGSNTNTVTLVNSGNVQLSQPIWYGRLQSTIRLHWSNTASKWIEDGRSEVTPFAIRSRYNALLAQRVDETELTLSGASTSWSSAIAIDDEVEHVVVRVTETITGAGVTAFLVGRGGDTDHWGNITSLTAGTLSFPRDYTDTTRYIAQSTQDIIITAVGGTFTGGKVRITKFWKHCDPPDA